MPMGTSSYTWRTPTEPEATVFHAAELKHRRVHPSGELRHRLWVLDYNYTPGERVRVHSVSAPWVERPARVAHLYAPGVPYWEDMARNARPVLIHCAFLQFEDPGFFRLRDLLSVPGGYARFFDEEGLVGELLAEIVRIAVFEQEAGYWAAYARFFEVLNCLHQAERLGAGEYRLRASQPDTPPVMVAQVQRYIHAHLAERITVADLAREAGMSLSALAHRYRELTDDTPMTTMRLARMDLPKGLLAKGSRLKEIAWQAGFADEFHLSKTFKQVEGMSPRAYRQRALAEGEGTPPGGADAADLP